MWGAGAGPGGNPWAPPTPQHHQPPPRQTGQPTPSSFSMNPTHYANIPHNQVDWAALAQQWMVLKGAGAGGGVNVQNQSIGGMPPMSMHPGMSGGRGMMHQHQHVPNVNVFAPNAPINSSQAVNHATPFHHLGRSSNSVGLGLKSQQDDGPPGVHSQGRATPLGDIIGEAPMELEEEPHPSKLQQNNWYAPEVNNPWSTALSNAAAAANESHSKVQFEAGNMPSVPTMGQQPRPITKNKNDRSAAAQRQSTATEYGYFNAHQQARGPGTAAPGYWSSNDDGSKDNPSSAAAALTEELQLGMSMLESHMPHYSYSSAMAGGGGEYSSDDNSMPEMDAARRKTLPAWIREGLEKMERQKHKKEEDERLAVEKEETRKRLLEEQAAQAAAALAQDPQIAASNSKWNQSESQPPSGDDDSGDDERREEPRGVHPAKIITLASILKNLPPDEQEDAIMYAIRRVSTTLLVNLTNEIIHDAALTSFTRAKRRKKVTSTTQVRKTSALASISGGFGLGLAGYGSDSEDSNASKSEDKDDNSESDGDKDSDDELTAEIDKKKRNWEMLKLELGQKTPRSRSASGVNNNDENIESSKPAEMKINVQDSNGGITSKIDNLEIRPTKPDETRPKNKFENRVYRSRSRSKSVEDSSGNRRRSNRSSSESSKTSDRSKSGGSSSKTDKHKSRPTKTNEVFAKPEKKSEKRFSRSRSKSMDDSGSRSRRHRRSRSSSVNSQRSRNGSSKNDKHRSSNKPDDGRSKRKSEKRVTRSRSRSKSVDDSKSRSRRRSRRSSSRHRRSRSNSDSSKTSDKSKNGGGSFKIDKSKKKSEKRVSRSRSRSRRKSVDRKRSRSRSRRHRSRSNSKTSDRSKKPKDKSRREKDSKSRKSKKDKKSRHRSSSSS